MYSQPMYSNMAAPTMTTMAAPMAYGAPSSVQMPQAPTMTSYGAASSVQMPMISGGMTTMQSPMTQMADRGFAAMAASQAVTTAAPSYATAQTTYTQSPTMSPSGSMTNLAAPMAFAAGSVTQTMPTSVATPQISYTAQPNQVTRMMSGPASYSQPMVASNGVSRMSSLGAMPAPQGSFSQHSAQNYLPMGGNFVHNGSSTRMLEGTGAPSLSELGSHFSKGKDLTFEGGVPKPVQMPKRPDDATRGVPNPTEVSQQELRYQTALDKQLEEGVYCLKKEVELEKQMIKFNTEKTIALFAMAEEEKQTEAFALLDEKLAIQSLELKKALVERNLQLSAQANGLRMDYQMKFLETELATKQYEFAVQYYNVEHKLEEDYAAQVALANTGTGTVGSLSAMSPYAAAR